MFLFPVAVWLGEITEVLWPKSTCGELLLFPCFCVGDCEGAERDRPEFLTEVWRSEAFLFTDPEETWYQQHAQGMDCECGMPV